MVLLDLDQFLLRVGRLYKGKKAGGSVWLTFKRISSDTKSRKGRKNARKLSGEGEAVLLARATDGAKVKLSCEVSAKDHLKFQIALSDMLKLELDGLKKRCAALPSARLYLSAASLVVRMRPAKPAPAICHRRDRKKEKEMKARR